MSKSRPNAPRKRSPEPEQDKANVPGARSDRLTGRAGVVCLGLVAIVFAVYWRVGGFEFINYDDHDYVAENYHVLAGLTWRGLAWAFTTGHTGNWHPLTWLSHMLDCQLFGLRPAGHHITNVVFHAINAALMFLVLKRLTSAFWRSAFIAALFAVHPLHVESVAWISERKDVLSTCFGLLCLLFYARYVQEKALGDYQKCKRDYKLAILFFGLGLMSKPMLVTWPFVMLLLDYWPLGRISVGNWRSTMGRLVREKMPFFLLAFVSSVVTFLVQRAGGAVESLSGTPVPVRIVNAIVSYARYLGKTLWPFDLAVPYPYPKGWLVSEVLISSVVVAVLCAAAIWSVRKRSYLFMGWFLFLGMLVPVIGLVQVGAQSMADRYTYMPITGLFIIMTWSAWKIAERLPALKITFSTIGILLLLALGFRAADQVGHWRNSGVLFTHSIAVTKDNEIAYSNLGNYYLENDRFDEAIDNFQRALEFARGREGAIEVFPSLWIDPARAWTCADVLNNLGTALAKKGQKKEAIEYYRAALRLRPNYAFALFNLGHELAGQKHFDEAIEFYEKALRLKPDQPDVLNAFGSVLMEVQRIDAAIDQFTEVLRIAPDNARAHNGLGLALAAKGKPVEAISHYRSALVSDANLIEVHNNLGSALIIVGQLDEAIVQLRTLLKLMPEHHRAHDNLGVALASKGDMDGAIVELQEAIRLNPDNAQTYFNLGNVLAMKRAFVDAAESFKEAVRLNPALAQAHCHLGGVLLELGRRDEAIAHLKEAVRLDPNYAQAKDQLRAQGVDVL